MALEVDAVIDRRRLSRRVSLWRALAILAVIGAIAAGALTQADFRDQHVARLSVSGTILADRPLLKLIKDLGKNDNVAGVLVSINSPGGTSVGGELLYDALRDLDGKKPVVAHITTLGASAAYMTALASDHIVAQRTSLTGSIGVLIQFGQISTLLDRWGIEVRKVDSGPLKAEPNPFEPTDPAAVAALQSVVDDTFDYFLGLVIDRRKMDEARARRLSDGRIYTGAQALENGLIDEIGSETAAIAWLERERGVPRDLPVQTYEPSEDSSFPFVAEISAAVTDRVLGALGIAITPQFPRGSVDGLWSIWHASGASSGGTIEK